MGYSSYESIPLDASDNWRIKRKLIKSILIFIIVSIFPIGILYYVFTNEGALSNLFSIDGIVYDVFGLILPGLILIKKYGDITDAIKFSKQGEKFIRRTKITSKADKVYYGRNSTTHYYTVDTDSGPVTIEDSYFGKSRDKVFAQLYVGAEVELIYSQDQKTLLDIRVDSSHLHLRSEGSSTSLSALKETAPLSAQDKNTLIIVCKRKWLDNIIQIIMLSLLAGPITLTCFTGEYGVAGFYLILIFDGALFFFCFMISRKFIFDYRRNKKEIYLTVVMDKINRKRHGVIFNNTPFKNKDSDYFIINTPLMEFYVPQELYETLEAGDNIRIEISPSSKTLLAVSKVK
jgi:hypothetical protein